MDADPPTASPQAALPDWAAVMRRIAGGDALAFRCLHHHFAPRLHRYLLGLGAPAARVEDLVQESMLRAWRAARMFDPGRAGAATWLYRIARNVHIDSLRRGSAVVCGEELPEHLASALHEGGDGASAPEAYVDQLGLGRAIAALPPVQARLVRMSFLEARSHSEIASELGMPLGSVKSSLRRAFSRLQRGLGAAAA